MNLTARLAFSQISANRKRTVWTLLGIVLSVSMITAVYGFAFSGFEAVHGLTPNLRDEYYLMFMIIGTILSAVIFSSSVIVMSNAFRVSAGQRLQQFGILKSVGATRRQISQTIMYEGIWLSALGIPMGIGVGLLVQFAGIIIANALLADINVGQPDAFTFEYIIAWQAILIAVVVGFVTVLVSAWLPARKAAKIPAIDAIRKQSETKIKISTLRSGKFIQKVFGFEGALAAKSLKRSKRNFRATVISLTISIVLFIGASSFGTQLNRMARLALHVVDADIIGRFHSNSTVVEIDEYGYPHFTNVPLDYATAELITTRLREFSGATVIGAGSSVGPRTMTGTLLPPDMASPRLREIRDPDGELKDLYVNFAIVSVDALTYAELIRRAGVPHGSNILMNYMRYRDELNRWEEVTPFIFNHQTITVFSGDGVIEIPLHGQLLGEQIPMEVIYVGWHNPVVVVPQFDTVTYFWYAKTDRHNEFSAHMRDVFDRYMPVCPSGNPADVFIHNINAEQNNDRAIIRLVMVFVYGFVGMLTLIGLTNVISTIATNIRARSREFAILQSTGMTPSGLNRMLNLESIFCSMKSLFFGIPLGVAVSFLIHRAILINMVFEFAIPVLPIVQCVLAVFLITWVTMRYAAARLRGGSLVEGIRGE